MRALRFPRRPSRLRARALAIAFAVVLAGCVREDDEPDLLDRALDTTRDATGLFEAKGPRARVSPPPGEGRPYPNLASVPPKPHRPVATIRDGELAALDRDRAAAEERRRALGEGIVGQQARDPGGEHVGSVLVDSIGAVSASDEAVLRRAIDLAGSAGEGRIRLAGEAGASLAMADRLARLGFRRDRIDLSPSPQLPAARRAVEISVARTAPGR